MRRRDFVGLLASVPVACISPGRAQQSGRRRRIGVLMGLVESDPQARKYLSAFRGVLSGLGWRDEQNLQIDVRATTDPEAMRSLISDLIASGSEILLTYTTPCTNAAHQATSSVPILFVAVSDPIGTGFVKSFSHPGGNITGFTNFEPTIGSKWVELMREIAPSVHRVAMLFNPATANTGASGGIYLESMKTAANSLGLELTVSPVSLPSEIDRAFAAVSEQLDGGLIVMPNVFTAANQERIVAQAAQHRVPTIYPLSHFVTAGGLISYGIDYADQFRLAASYADRILRGTKPADLPVQQPTKFELVINRKAAHELGLTIPASLLANGRQLDRLARFLAGRTSWLRCAMSAFEGIVLQKSKVAPVQIFGENHKRKEVDDSHSLSRATEVAHEFGVRRCGPSNSYTNNAPAALRNLTTSAKRLLQHYRGNTRSRISGLSGAAF